MVTSNTVVARRKRPLISSYYGVRRVAVLGAPGNLGIPAGGPALLAGPARILAELSLSEEARHLLHVEGSLAPASAGNAQGQELFALVRRRAAEAAAATARLVAAEECPVTIGGDHSISLGTIAGVAAGLRLLSEPAPPLWVVWIDAHPDLNTHWTSPSGNPHGMVLAALLGEGHPLLVGDGPVLSPDHVVLVGVRAIDPGEHEYLKRTPLLRVSTPAAVRAEGPQRLATRIAQDVARAGGRLYVSFDLDAVDPSAAPGVSTPVPHGLQPAEVLELLDALAHSGLLVGADVVEYNPAKDRERATARLAAEAVIRLARGAAGAR
jgi:arginase